MPDIKLQSCDGEIYTVDIEVAKMSETIETLMDDLGLDESEDIEDVLPLPNVTSSILRKVTEWATQHMDDPPPPPEDDEDIPRRTDDISEWDKTFLQVMKVKMISFPTNSRRPSRLTANLFQQTAIVNSPLFVKNDNLFYAYFRLTTAPSLS